MNSPRIGSDVARAAHLLRAGELVAFPTETVYGLGADATNDAALARLYDVKGRPLSHPVIVHVASAERLDDVAHTPPPYARKLAAAFWPGPLTLIVERRPGAVSDRATGGRSTVGVRVPDHPLARHLLELVGRGVAAPSANRFGRVSPTTAQHVVDDLGDDVALVLDGGECRVGVESTIVDCTDEVPRVLRVGGVTLEALAEVIGAPLAVGGTTAAPGTLPSHYAPHARVRLASADCVAEEAAAVCDAQTRVGVLAMDVPADLDPMVVVLDAPGSVEEFAHTLYARLRDADAAGLEVLFVVPPPAAGLGVAVIDRLERAAHEAAGPA
ncbi:MAG: L-threonylcarbamoyladenylate synthase [Acidimicrobiia bacterium]